MSAEQEREPTWVELLDGGGVLDDRMVARSRFEDRGKDVSQLVRERLTLLAERDSLRDQLHRTQANAAGVPR